MPRRPGNSWLVLATFELRNEVNATSAVVGPEVSEVDLARLEMTPSIAVRPPARQTLADRAMSANTSRR